MAAKVEGLAVTAEAAPHHLSLTDDALRGFDPVFKVNPPLRTAADVEALALGLADGTIDAVATDHAPHPASDKERPLDEAPPGMVGLETALGVCLPVLQRAGMSLVETSRFIETPPTSASARLEPGAALARGDSCSFSTTTPSPGAARSRRCSRRCAPIPAAAAAGSRLLFPDGPIQSAGLLLAYGLPYPLSVIPRGYRKPASETPPSGPVTRGHRGLHAGPRRCVPRRRRLRRGLRERLRGRRLCLRLGEAGGKILFVAEAW